jgi:hypothetical protein
MAVDNLPNWKSGLPILADWLKAMVDAIRANRVIIDKSTGLTSLQTPNGQQVGYHPTPVIAYAVITTDCPALTTPSGVRTMGKGAGTIYYTAYSTSGVGTILTTGQTGVAIYNPGNELVASGKLAEVHKIQGQWNLISVIC